MTFSVEFSSMLSKFLLISFSGAQIPVCHVFSTMLVGKMKELCERTRESNGLRCRM